jgi:type IV secretion system protein TrbE
MFKAKNKMQGLDQLFNFSALIDENVILNKDGSLMSGFYYTAPDASTISNSQLSIITSKINQASKVLTDGYSIYFEVVRTQSNSYPTEKQNSFNDNVSKAIDAERRDLFSKVDAHFESKYAIIVCFHQQSKSSAKVDKWLFGDEDKKGSFDKVLFQFKAIVDDFVKNLGYSLKIQPMKSIILDNSYVQDELCNFLRSCLLGGTSDISLEGPLIDLDKRLANRDFIAGNVCKLGDKYIKVVTIIGFPQHVYANILGSLDMLNIGYRWSTRFIFLDKVESEKILSTKEKSWDEQIFTYKDMLAQKIGMTSGKPNRDAINMSEDANSALNQERAGEVRYGYYTTAIILMHENIDVVQSQAKFVSEVIQNSYSFDAHIETLNTTDAFFGSIAGNIRCNKRKTPMNTLNLAFLVQTSTVYCGEQYSPNPFLEAKSPPLAYARTNGSNPYRLNLHVRDVGHTLIVGPTGNGKSTLLAFLLAQYLRYPNAKIFAFDKKESLYAITKQVKGLHYHPLKDGLKLCPLALAKDAESIAWATSYLCSIIELQNVTLTSSKRENIFNMVNQFNKLGYKSLTSFIGMMGDSTISSALRNYATDGILGGLLDGEENNIEFAQFNTFELDSLLKLGEKNVAAVLGFLFRYIESQLDGSPCIIALEEVWLVMLRDFFKKQFVEWLVTLRKQNCLVIFTCQNLAQLYSTDSSTLSAVIDSTATKIFLPNSEAGQKGTSERAGNFELYSMFGLSEHEIENVITKATPKRDYYIKQEHGSRLIQFDFGPISLEYCGLSGTDEVAEFKNKELSALENKDIVYEPS